MAREIGPAARPIACHVGRLADLEALVATTTREFGRIDILVNNAGTNVGQGPCLEMDEGQFDKMVEMNLKSAFRLMKLVAPGMCERGSGSIINIVIHLRPASAVAGHALQHDQGRAHHDDAVLRP